MLSEVFDPHGIPFEQVVGAALAHLQKCQSADEAMPDASIVEHPTANLLRYWDAVNALKAIALCPHAAQATDPKGAVMTTSRGNGPVEPFAIVGIDCGLPGGATDRESSWQLLESGTDEIGAEPAGPSGR